MLQYDLMSTDYISLALFPKKSHPEVMGSKLQQLFSGTQPIKPGEVWVQAQIGKSSLGRKSLCKLMLV